jgi:tetratricopeptide (TPR) repeat protein
MVVFACAAVYLAATSLTSHNRFRYGEEWKIRWGESGLGAFPSVEEEKAIKVAANGFDDGFAQRIMRQYEHRSSQLPRLKLRLRSVHEITNEHRRKPKAILVASTPEMGVDSEGAFTVPVMERLVKLCYESAGVKVAYDWAGSTNTFADDKRVWAEIFEKRNEAGKTRTEVWNEAVDEAAKAAALEPISVLVKQTRWFASYTGKIKQSIMLSYQDGKDAILACIQGGPISRVEMAEMPRVLDEALNDVHSGHVRQTSASFEIRSFATVEEFETFVSQCDKREQRIAHQLELVKLQMREMDSLRMQGQTLKAEVYEQTMHACEGLINSAHPITTALRFNHALTLHMEGENARALEMLTFVVAVDKSVSESSSDNSMAVLQEVESNCALGAVCSDMLMFQEALEHFSEAIRKLESIGQEQSADAGRIKTEMGSVLCSMQRVGSWLEAKKQWLEADQILEHATAQVLVNADRGKVHYLLAGLHRTLNDLTSARDHAKRALAFFMEAFDDGTHRYVVLAKQRLLEVAPYPLRDCMVGVQRVATGCLVGFFRCIMRITDAA